MDQKLNFNWWAIFILAVGASMGGLAREIDIAQKKQTLVWINLIGGVVISLAGGIFFGAVALGFTENIWVAFGVSGFAGFGGAVLLKASDSAIKKKTKEVIKDGKIS